jgi:hypothetical protein
MRPQVEQLVALGPFPSEDEATDEDVEQREALVTSISRPVTDDEARALATLFGPDTFYGGAWTVLHLIETAPGWPLEDALQNEDNEWIRLLRQRLENARNR